MKHIFCYNIRNLEENIHGNRRKWEINQSNERNMLIISRALSEHKLQKDYFSFKMGFILKSASKKKYS